jgi:hypothetical protein
MVCTKTNTHHLGVHGITCQRDVVRPVGEHHGHDQGYLDHRDREGQHQRSEWFAHPVRHHLGVMDGRDHDRHQSDGNEGPHHAQLASPFACR